jgi:mannosyltransferase OCH1-like enzyme
VKLVLVSIQQTSLDSQTKMIPRLIHFVWLGPAARPEAIFDSWRRHHQDWNVTVWDEDRLHDLQLYSQEFYSRLRTRQYNQRSDVLRLEKL